MAAEGERPRGECGGRGGGDVESRVCGAVAVGLLGDGVAKSVDGEGFGGKERRAKFGRFRHAEAGEAGSRSGHAEGRVRAGVREGIARGFLPPRGVEEGEGGFVGRNDVGSGKVDGAVQVHVACRHAERAEGVVEVEGAGAEGAGLRIDLTQRTQSQNFTRSSRSPRSRLVGQGVFF